MSETWDSPRPWVRGSSRGNLNGLSEPGSLEHEVPLDPTRVSPIVGLLAPAVARTTKPVPAAG